MFLRYESYASQGLRRRAQRASGHLKLVRQHDVRIGVWSTKNVDVVAEQRLDCRRDRPDENNEILPPIRPETKRNFEEDIVGRGMDRARRAHLPGPPCAVERTCGQGRETLQHLWWKCELWNICRQRYADQIANLNMEDLSVATKELGIYTLSTFGSDIWIQQVMISIFTRRYEGM